VTAGSVRFDPTVVTRANVVPMWVSEQLSQVTALVAEWTSLIGRAASKWDQEGTWGTIR